MSIFKNKKTRPLPVAPHAGPCFEPLESRELLSASIIDSTLIVLGSGGDNVISITEKGDNTVVKFSGDFSASFTLLKANYNMINIDALGGNDRITIADGLEHPVSVNGGDGNDSIEGAAGDDSLNGGNGDDRIRKGPNDILIGDTTGDTVVNDPGFTVDNGKLTIYGGDGKDKIRVQSLGNGIVGFAINNVAYEPVSGVTSLCIDGKDGDDKIDLDGQFPDGTGNPLPITLLGGNGNDKIDVEDPRNVSVNGGDGDDKIKVGPTGTAGNGNHATLTGGNGTDAFTAGQNDLITDAQEGEKVKRK